MPLTIKAMIVLLILGIAGLFVIKKPDGTPWLSLNSFMPDTSAISHTTSVISDTLKQATSSTTNSNESDSQGIYRWRDEQGNWQYSDKRPDNIAAESLSISGNLNRDLAEPPVSAPTTSQAGTATDGNKASGLGLSPTTISPEKISKLIEDTQQVQGLIDKRASELEKASQ